MIRKLTLALLASSALLPVAAAAQELPTGSEVQAGAVTISTTAPGAMRIQQGTDRAVVNWQSFSVGQGGRVDIEQPGATSALLNRVTGTATSEIAGQINANGRVFLVNPNGILITATGTVNAAGFTASTLDIADQDFMAGSDDVTVTASRGGERVGYVRGGFAGVMGGEGKGLVLAGVSADAGGAIDLGGDGFLQVAMPAGGIAVAGRVNAQQIVLTAGAARGAARGVVNISGTLDASSVTARGGTIALGGERVELTGATLNASGATGGGSVTVGAAQGALVAAQAVSVDATTRVLADATRAGDGGTRAAVGRRRDRLRRHDQRARRWRRRRWRCGGVGA